MPEYSVKILLSKMGTVSQSTVVLDFPVFQTTVIPGVDGVFRTSDDVADETQGRAGIRQG